MTLNFNFMLKKKFSACENHQSYPTTKKRKFVQLFKETFYLFFDNVRCFSANSTSFLSTYKPFLSRIESM